MHKHTKTSSGREAILWVNLVFVGISALLILYYVMMANSVASKNYHVQSLRHDIESLSETNSSLMSKKLALESPATLTELALAQNLEQVKNIEYIFENKDVARR
jgi:hypothetical protein